MSDACSPPDGTESELLSEITQASHMIRTWIPEAFPANEKGQVHFARAIMESVAPVLDVAAAEVAALRTEVARLREALELALDTLEIGHKMKHPEWDGTSHPYGAIGKARLALGKGSPNA